MNHQAPPLRSIVIVDPAGDDYRALIDDERSETIEFRYFRTAEEALRSGPPEQAAWLIHDRLPDMCGLELIELLRPSIGRCPVFLIGDEYDPAVELAALCAGSVHFLTKPLTPALLTQLAPSRSAELLRRRQSRTAVLAAEAWEMPATVS